MPRRTNQAATATAQPTAAAGRAQRSQRQCEAEKEVKSTQPAFAPAATHESGERQFGEHRESNERGEYEGQEEADGRIPLAEIAELSSNGILTMNESSFRCCLLDPFTTHLLWVV